MATRSERLVPRPLPSILVAVDRALPFEEAGGRPGDPVPDGAAAWLLRDLDLPGLVRIGESRHPMLAVDVDSVEGLNADSAAVRFLVLELGVDAIVSRRPALAVQAAGLGAIGLAHLFAFDSTGLRRSLEGVPAGAGVGVVISPGIVVPHLTEDDLESLPRPLVAYGLVERPEQATGLLRLADAVVVRPELYAAVRAMQRTAAREPRIAGPHRFALDTATETI